MWFSFTIRLWITLNNLYVFNLSFRVCDNSKHRSLHSVRIYSFDFSPICASSLSSEQNLSLFITRQEFNIVITISFIIRSPWTLHVGSILGVTDFLEFVHRLVIWKHSVSEEHIASIFRAEKWAEQETSVNPVGKQRDRVVRWKSTDVSEEHIASIFRSENKPSKKPVWTQLASGVTV
jgi:hypothetical protein